MNNLSPAAQAIEDAVDNAWSNSRARAAAALRAAVVQVVPVSTNARQMKIRDKFLAIADELEGADA